MSSGWSNGSPILVIITEVTGFSGLFFYSPTVGPGNLVGSWTVAAGTDPFGNAYPAGLMLRNGASEITLNSQSGIITETFITGNPDVDISAFIQAAATGLGTAQVDQWLITSAQNTINQDTAGLVVQSNNNLNSNGAKAYLFYESPTGGQQNYLVVSCAGTVIKAGSLTAAQPGTGASLTNVAIPETWHSATPLLAANWTTLGAGNPLRYRLEGIGAGVVRLDGQANTAGAGPWPPAAMLTLPAGYQQSMFHSFTTPSAIDVTANQATVQAFIGGVIHNAQTFTAAGQDLIFDGITFPLD